MKNQILISPKKLSQILIVVIMVLIIASVIVSYWEKMSYDNNFLLEMQESYIRLFNINGEANIPAWFSSCILLLSSFLLGLIAICKKMNRDSYILHWSVLSFIFLCLSLDETAILHEMSVKPLRSIFHLGGFFYYGWIIPAGIAVVVTGLAYLRFLINLPQKTKRLFLIAACIFVGGAIGLEAFSGLYDDMFNQGRIVSDDFVIIFETIEEFMEMTGTVIFIYSLLDYLNSHYEIISFRIKNL